MASAHSEAQLETRCPSGVSKEEFVSVFQPTHSTFKRLPLPHEEFDRLASNQRRLVVIMVNKGKPTIARTYSPYSPISSAPSYSSPSTSSNLARSTLYPTFAPLSTYWYNATRPFAQQTQADNSNHTYILFYFVLFVVPVMVWFFIFCLKHRVPDKYVRRGESIYLGTPAPTHSVHHFCVCLFLVLRMQRISLQLLEPHSQQEEQMFLFEKPLRKLTW